MGACWKKEHKKMTEPDHPPVTKRDERLARLQAFRQLSIREGKSPQSSLENISRFSNYSRRSLRSHEPEGEVVPAPRVVQITMPAARSERLLTPIIWRFPGVEIEFESNSSEGGAEEERERAPRP